MRTLDEIQQCAEVLGKLVQMGAKTEHLGVLEEAYWNLLRTPGGGRFAIASPFLGGMRSIDYMQCAEALREFAPLPGPVRELAEDALFTLLHSAMGDLWGNGIAAALSQKPKAPPLEAFLRCAVFVAFARMSGAQTSRKGELETLAIEELLAVREEPGDGEAEEKVRQQLGISMRDWRR